MWHYEVHAGILIGSILIWSHIGTLSCLFMSTVLLHIQKTASHSTSSYLLALVMFPLSSITSPESIEVL